MTMGPTLPPFDIGVTTTAVGVGGDDAAGTMGVLLLPAPDDSGGAALAVGAGRGGTNTTGVAMGLPPPDTPAVGVGRGTTTGGYTTAPGGGSDAAATMGPVVCAGLSPLTCGGVDAAMLDLPTFASAAGATPATGSPTLVAPTGLSKGLVALPVSTPFAALLPSPVVTFFDDAVLLVKVTTS